MDACRRFAQNSRILSNSPLLPNSYASFVLSSLGPRREMLEKKISKSITQKEILICKVTLMQDAKSTKKSTKQQEDKQGCLT